MIHLTSEEFASLFPGAREEAERLGVHPDFRDTYVPLTIGRPPFTNEQREVLFPSDRRVPVMRDILKTGAVQEETMVAS